MINKFLKLLILCFGMMLSLDALLPTKKHELQIDHQGKISNLGNKYRVFFKSDQLSACAVDRIYDQLNSDDMVVVHTTRINKLCVKIAKSGIEIYKSNFWRLLALVIGLVFCAYGWYQPRRWWG